jgi:hypothetical protein
MGMLIMTDYIAVAALLLSAAALVYAARRRGRVRFVKRPPDPDALRKHIAVVYTSAAFASYGERQERPASAARPLSKRERLLQKLNEAVVGGAPAAAGGASPDSGAAGGAFPDSDAAGVSSPGSDDAGVSSPGSADGDANDYPDDDDVDSAAVAEGAPPAEANDSDNTDGAQGSGEVAQPDPAADFFNNEQWKS